METRIESVSVPIRAAHTGSTPLLDILNALGIAIIDTESVVAYQRSKIEEVAVQHTPRFSKRMPGPIDREQECEARRWAGEKKMSLYEIRYHVGLWGFGAPYSRVIG